MVLNAESKYPSRLAYVLKLRHDALPDALAGRIENLVTGDQQAFETASALLACLVGDLEAASAERDAQAADRQDPDVDRTTTAR